MKINGSYLDISRRYWLLLAGGCSILTVALWLVFDLYQRTVAEEVLTGFLKAEAVAIQEGNLLSSVAKNQRMLLSSQFVKGIVLLDCSASPPKQLMILGTGNQVSNCFGLESERVSVFSSGFLKTFSAREIKGHSDLQLVFHVESGFLKTLFGAFSIGFLGLFLGIFGFFQNLKKRELIERQIMLKEAINSFIDESSSGAVLQEELPDLKDWIVNRKTDLKKAHEEIIQARKQEALVEVARRIAHDIRSPLQTLGVVLENLNSLPSEKRKMAQIALNRIYQISKGIVNESPKSVKSEPAIQEKIWLWGLIDKMIQEKRTQYQSRDVELRFSSNFDSASTFIFGNSVELSRSLSNLLDNSVESLSVDGLVAVDLRLEDKFTVIQISDNGCGIPAEILRRIGEKGFSSGKNGNGLGVHYAKNLVQEELGGRFEVSSEHSVGTQILITLPTAEAPKWFVARIPDSKNLVVLDDDPVIHEKIRMRFGSRLNTHHFLEPKELRKWSQKNKIEYILLTDFDLGSDNVSGLDFVLTQDLVPRSVLMTNSYDEADLQRKAEEAGLQILPKPLLEFS